MSEREPFLDLTREHTQLLKGWAILLVLLGHLYYVPFGGAAGVAIFLALSGYGLNLSCEKNGHRLFWNKRLRKVWLPYFLVAVFNVLALRAQGRAAILCTLLGLDLDRNIDATMWYISYLFLWYLVYYCLLRLTAALPRRGLREAIKLGGLLLASLGFRWLDRLGVWHPAASAATYWLAFPLGVALSQLRFLRVSHRCRFGLWFLILFLSTAYLIRIYPFQWNSALMTSVVLAQAIAVLQLVSLPRAVQAPLAWFGAHSYPIYLFEWLFFNVRADWFAAFSAKFLIDLAFLAATSLVAAVYWSCWKKLDAMLPLDRFLRF